MSFQEYRSGKTREAEQFQDFVADSLYDIGFPIGCYSSKKYQYNTGENRAGVEIKYDQLVSEKGNLFIETAEKSDPSRSEFTDSGIFRQDNSWLYVIGDYETIWIFCKTTLRLLYEKKRTNGDFFFTRTGEKTFGTSKGYLLPRTAADIYAGKILSFYTHEEIIGPTHEYQYVKPHMRPCESWPEPADATNQQSIFDS